MSSCRESSRGGAVYAQQLTEPDALPHGSVRDLLPDRPRAVVVADDRLAVIYEKLRARQDIFLWIPVRVRFEMNFLETVTRIFRCAAVR